LTQARHGDPCGSHDLSKSDNHGRMASAVSAKKTWHQLP
jgi:hypothetical protein